MESRESPFTLTIDWLAFTVPHASSHQETIKVLGGDWTKTEGGFRGYPLSWICTDGSRGVGKLGTGAPRRPREVHVDLSAGIVAAWPIEKIRQVLHWIKAKEGHVTRIDCALDDRQPLVPLATIRAAIDADHCVTRAKHLRAIRAFLIHEGTTTGETLYFGSPQSQTMLRIYDKRLELQAKQREDWQGYGIRWELEFKKERADACARCLAVLEESDWREFVVSLLRSYLDFRATSPDGEEDDRYRAPLLPWYAELTEGFQKGRLVIEQDEPTIPKVQRWVSQSLTPMLAVLCAIPGGETWLRNAIADGPDRWKDKHRRLMKSKPRPTSNHHAGGNAGGRL